MPKHADITHIQTGAERAAGDPGQPFNQSLQDVRDRQKAWKEAEKAAIEEARARSRAARGGRRRR